MKDNKEYNGALEYLKAALLGKPLGGKSTVIMPNGSYEIDENYDPPIVSKIKDKK